MPKKKKSKVRNITEEEYEQYILSLQNEPSEEAISSGTGEKRK